MNDAHLEALSGDEWRTTLRELAIPFALDGAPFSALGDDVLEIGPGPGLTTDILSAELPALTALEIDSQLAGDLAERYSAEASVTVVAGDATKMSFADGRFSGVVCFTMLHHVAEIAMQDLIFAEARRVLRPGGLFVANDAVAHDDLAAFHEGDVYNPVDPGILGDRLEKAGFVDIVVRVNPFAWAAQARSPR